MKIDKSLTCPKCGGIYFTMKREAAYLYTYYINTPDTENWSKENDGLSFLFDYREQLSDREYIQCEKCRTKYPCDMKLADENVDFTILQKAIRSEFVTNAEYLG